MWKFHALARVQAEQPGNILFMKYGQFWQNQSIKFCFWTVINRAPPPKPLWWWIWSYFWQLALMKGWMSQRHCHKKTLLFCLPKVVSCLNFSAPHERGCIISDNTLVWGSCDNWGPMMIVMWMFTDELAPRLVYEGFPERRLEKHTRWSNCAITLGTKLFFW